MLTETERRVVGALRQVAISSVLACKPCDGTGRLARGPGLGNRCPECQAAREVIAASSSMFGPIRKRIRRTAAA